MCQRFLSECVFILSVTVVVYLILAGWFVVLSGSSPTGTLSNVFVCVHACVCEPDVGLQERQADRTGVTTTPQLLIWN